MIASTATKQSPLATAALEYATKYGWCPVILGTKGKVPVDDAWQDVSTTDPDLIKQRWAKNPRANVGVQLGPKSGIVDFECDDSAAEEKLAELFDGSIPVCPTFKSSRGVHRLFKYSPDLPKKGTQKVGKIDVKIGGGDKGSQSVFPPSIHPTGAKYEWIDGLSPDLVDPPELPSAVIAKLKVIAEPVPPPRPPGNSNRTRPADRNRIVERAAKYVAKLPAAVSGQGGHDSTFHAACVAVLRFGLTQDEAWPILVEFNDRCEPPWSEHDLRRKLDEADKQGGPRGELLNDDNGQRGISGIGGGSSGDNVELNADGRRQIVIGPDLKRMNDDGVTCLERAEVYQRGGQLSQVITPPASRDGITWPDGSIRIAPIKFSTLAEILTTVADFVRPVPGEDGGPPTHKSVLPPELVVRGIGERGQYPATIRPLVGIVETPVIRPDGSILDEPGYDSRTGYLLEPSCRFTKPIGDPSREDALAAAGRLLEIVADFPFRLEAYRTAWLAALLTPFVRTAYHGPAPFHLIDGNVPGCGKGLLTSCLGVIWTGRQLPVMSSPQNDQECRKRITTLVLCGDRFVCIDNISGTFGCPSLEAAITSTHWSDRRLSLNEKAEGPLLLNWVGTANNCVLTSDMTRRVNHIRLESPLEQPEARTGFKHADLISYVRSQRSSFIQDCLTIVRAYVVAGSPVMSIPEWGSFEGWSKWVRAPLVWLGLPDPASTREELRSTSDRTSGALRQLIHALSELDPGAEGLTSGEIVRRSEIQGSEHDLLREALYELAGGGPGKSPSPLSVGRKFTHVKGRNCRGRCIDSRTNRTGAAIWFVRTLEPETPPVVEMEVVTI